MSRQLTSGVLGKRKIEYAVDFSGGTRSGFALTTPTYWDIGYEVHIIMTLEGITSTEYFIGNSPLLGTVGVRYNGSDFLVRHGDTFTTVNYTALSGFIDLKFKRISATETEIRVNSSLIGTAIHADSTNFNIGYIGMYLSTINLNYTGKIKYFSISDNSASRILEYLMNEGEGTTLYDNMGTNNAEWIEFDGSSPIWEKL